MKVKYILFSVILLGYFNGYSQDKEPYELQLFFTGMAKNYKIEILKSEMNTVMVVGKDTSTAVLSDRHMEMARKMMVESEDGAKKVIQIIEGYKKYKTDTVNIKAGSPMEQTVNNFVENWGRIQREMENNPDKRFIIDGYQLRIGMKKNYESYGPIYAHSPSAESHPEIFKLISTMDSFYQAESPDPIIE